jgi:hypothetical protein
VTTLHNHMTTSFQSARTEVNLKLAAVAEQCWLHVMWNMAWSAHLGGHLHT